MKTPSKEALEVAKKLFSGEFFPQIEVAFIIDRHFAPVRQRAEQAADSIKELRMHLSATDSRWRALGDELIAANSRVKELEHGLKHQCDTCEMKSIFDGEHAYALKMQARVKELEASNEALNTLIRAHSSLSQGDIDAFCADFSEIAALLNTTPPITPEMLERLKRAADSVDAGEPCSSVSGMPKYALTGNVGQQLPAKAGVVGGLHDCPRCGTRHSVGPCSNFVSEPAKHPDTERLDWLEQSEAVVTIDRRLPHPVEIATDKTDSVFADSLRAAIDAARKEVQP